MQLQLSNELNDILTYAKEEAMRLGNYTVSTDHLVLGILRHRENITVETLVQLGTNPAQLKAYLEDAVRASEPVPMEKENALALSKASENALKIMFLEARSLHAVKPDSSHLFLAILRAQDGNAVQYLEQHEITYEKVRNIIAAEDNMQDPATHAADDDEVMENRKEEKKKNSSNTIMTGAAKASQSGKTPVLDSFGFDLTKAAMAAAKSADVVLFCMGLDETAESEGADREHMQIPQVQLSLLNAVHMANPNVVLVLSGGSPFVLPEGSYVTDYED